MKHLRKEKYNLNKEKYTDFYNSYTWSYKKPSGFVDNTAGCYVIAIRNTQRNIYLYHKKKINPSITRMENLAITAGELFF